MNECWIIFPIQNSTFCSKTFCVGSSETRTNYTGFCASYTIFWIALTEISFWTFYSSELAMILNKNILFNEIIAYHLNMPF